MPLDLESELAGISEMLDKAKAQAAYWSDEVKRLTGAKDFGKHLLRLSREEEAARPSPTPGMMGLDDDDAPALVPVGAGQSGSRA